MCVIFVNTTRLIRQFVNHGSMYATMHRVRTWLESCVSGFRVPCPTFSADEKCRSMVTLRWAEMGSSRATRKYSVSCSLRDDEFAPGLAPDCGKTKFMLACM